MKALVTGVTRGIGRSIVDHLVEQGWAVAAVAAVVTAVRVPVQPPRQPGSGRAGEGRRGGVGRRYV